MCICVPVYVYLGALQRKKIPKIRDYYRSGCRSHSEFVFFGKSSQNSPKPVLIYWSSISCVFCLYYTLLKVVGYYDLSVLSISVMGFQKKFGGRVGGVSSIQVFLEFV